jgi:signal peptidase II
MSRIISGTRNELTLFVSLFVTDQAVKLLIAGRFLNARFVIIPNFLHFLPVQNRNLNWIASIADYRTTTVQMVFIQIAAAVIVVLVYEYCIFLSGGRQPHLDRFLIFFESGIFCSFLDVVFWGGSLDFIALLNWFVFDIKDVYISVGVVSLLLFSVNYLQKYYRLDKKEQKRLKRQCCFSQWIKSLCHAAK